MYGCVRGCGRGSTKKGLDYGNAGHFTVAHRQEATGLTPADNRIYNHSQNQDSSPGLVYQMWLSTSLTLSLLNTVSSLCSGDPCAHKLLLVLLQKCNFAIVMNCHKYLTCRISDLQPL